MKKIKKINLKKISLFGLIIIIGVIIFLFATCLFGGKIAQAKPNVWGWEPKVEVTQETKRVTMDYSKKTGTTLIPVLNNNLYGSYIRTTLSRFTLYKIPKGESWEDYSSNFSQVFIGRTYEKDVCVYLEPGYEYVVVLHNTYSLFLENMLYIGARKCP